MMAGIVVFAQTDTLICLIAATICAITLILIHRHWLAFLFLFFCLGWVISYADAPSAPPDDAFSSKACWNGCVSDIKHTTAATRITVNVYHSDKAEIVEPFKCSLLLPDANSSIEPGDIISFTGRLSAPQAEADIPDEKSFNPTFYVDGITASAYVSPDDITIDGHTRSLKRTALRLQNDLRDLIYRSTISSPTAWFLSTTLLGDDSMLDPTVKEQFRSIGAAHYLALSGFHIGIIAMLASLAFFPLKTWSRFGRLRHIGVIAIIWLYAFACGLSPSLTRAAILISIYLSAKLLQRQSSPYNSLCIAAILILAFAPRQLFAPGFQLSFCAVLAILSIAPLLNPFQKTSTTAYRAASFVTVPLAAMAGTCFITMIHFHRFPVIFLIPNLILGILLPLLLSAGAIMMLATFIGIKLSSVGMITDKIYNAVENMSETISSWSGTEITGVFLTPATIAAGVAAIAAMTIALHSKRRIAFIAAACLSASAFLLHQLMPAQKPYELYITRQPLRTDIVIRDGDKACLITTADKREHAEIERSLSSRYSDFLARRNCNAHLTVAQGDFDMPSIRKRGDYIIAGDKIILTGKTADSGLHIDYLLITRRSGNRPLDIVKTVRPDTVIISRDTPHKRAQKLIDSCSTLSIPTLWLTERSFSLTPP